MPADDGDGRSEASSIDFEQVPAGSALRGAGDRKRAREVRVVPPQGGSPSGHSRGNMASRASMAQSCESLQFVECPADTSGSKPGGSVSQATLATSAGSLQFQTMAELGDTVAELQPNTVPAAVRRTPHAYRNAQQHTTSASSADEGRRSEAETQQSLQFEPVGADTGRDSPATMASLQFVECDSPTHRAAAARASLSPQPHVHHSPSKPVPRGGDLSDQDQESILFEQQSHCSSHHHDGSPNRGAPPPQAARAQPPDAAAGSERGAVQAGPEAATAGSDSLHVPPARRSGAGRGQRRQPVVTRPPAPRPAPAVAAAPARQPAAPVVSAAAAQGGDAGRTSSSPPPAAAAPAAPAAAAHGAPHGEQQGQWQTQLRGDGRGVGPDDGGSHRPAWHTAVPRRFAHYRRDVAYHGSTFGAPPQAQRASTPLERSGHFAKPRDIDQARQQQAAAVHQSPDLRVAERRFVPVLQGRSNGTFGEAQPVDVEKRKKLAAQFSGVGSKFMEWYGEVRAKTPPARRTQTPPTARPERPAWRPSGPTLAVTPRGTVPTAAAAPANAAAVAAAIQLSDGDCSPTEAEVRRLRQENQRLRRQMEQQRRASPPPPEAPPDRQPLTLDEAVAVAAAAAGQVSPGRALQPTGASSRGSSPCGATLLPRDGAPAPTRQPDAPEQIWPAIPWAPASAPRSADGSPTDPLPQGDSGATRQPGSRSRRTDRDGVARERRPASSAHAAQRGSAAAGSVGTRRRGRSAPAASAAAAAEARGGAPAELPAQRGGSGSGGECSTLVETASGGQAPRGTQAPLSHRVHQLEQMESDLRRQLRAKLHRDQRPPPQQCAPPVWLRAPPREESPLRSSPSRYSVADPPPLRDMHDVGRPLRLCGNVYGNRRSGDHSVAPRSRGDGVSRERIALDRFYRRRWS
eukprot:TRINITY_DN7295_c0_g1_i1.p1 TRINITY_DN7295_c0_g1~~TRINITY_DN7295_c0_g1_i1.p1  ORF type:complete len:949 (+),score=131.32 TRINITY_DN7295_c0_g1_i1:103-2847(+)